MAEFFLDHKKYMKINIHLKQGLRQGWIFWAVALVLFLILTSYFIYAIGFVTENINAFLDRDYNDSGLIIRYDFGNFNKVISGKIISQ